MIQLQIETTSICNAACGFCVYPTAGRAGPPMSMVLYRKIIDEAAGIHLITEICLTGLGEPTLDPMLIDRVGYAKGRIPKAVVGLYTNGVYMTPARFELLRGVGIGYVVFSLNAVRPEQHESQMGLKDKFYEVCNNIDYAIANADAVHVEVRAVATPGAWTRQDYEEFYKRWGHRSAGGKGQVILQGNWTGDIETSRKFVPNEACGRALNQVYVTSSGLVTTCCFDPTGKQVWGDLKSRSLKQIYAYKPYVDFREAHYENRADEYAICKTCTRI